MSNTLPKFLIVPQYEELCAIVDSTLIKALINIIPTPGLSGEACQAARAEKLKAAGYSNATAEGFVDLAIQVVTAGVDEKDKKRADLDKAIVDFAKKLEIGDDVIRKISASLETYTEILMDGILDAKRTNEERDKKTKKLRQP